MARLLTPEGEATLDAEIAQGARLRAGPAVMVSLTEELLRRMPLSDVHAGLRARLGDPEYARGLCQSGCGCAMVENDQPVMIGGVVPVWPGRGLAWFAAAPDPLLAHWLRAARFTRSLLASLPQRRIETTISANYPEGCRWAEALGFDREGLMRGFGEDGKDFWLYARIKPKEA
jgi:hypothetical protein